MSTTAHSNLTQVVLLSAVTLIAIIQKVHSSAPLWRQAKLVPKLNSDLKDTASRFEDEQQRMPGL